MADGLAEARGGLSSDRRQQDRRLHVDPSAFKAASGRPTSTPTYTYQRGPDGRFFVIGSDGDALVVDDPAPGHGSSPAATVDPAFNRTEAAPGARTESGYPTVSLAPTPLARTAVFAYSSAARYFQATPTHLHLIV